MPSAFTGPIRLEHLDADWRKWRLLEPLIWEVDNLGSGRFVQVPPGFVTDGASVPQVLWWFLPSTGAYLRAAALHDYLLDQLRSGASHRFASTKGRADRQFRLAMAACGVAAPVRWIMWASVRIWGKR